MKTTTNTSRRQALIVAVSVVVVLAVPWTALAFPPYRSTDAETADPWSLEGRLGLVRVKRDQGENAYVAPLLRVNLGLPHHLELVLEGEWSATHGRLGDAAAGFKWVPYMYLDRFSVGVEALALVPLSSAVGSGIEAQLVATQRWQPVQVHLNGGGFYDARSTPAEKGWRGSLLGEVRLGRFRPGMELFAKQVNSAAVEPLAGAGVIVGLGPFDVRTGVHMGLTAAATDVIASLWIASKLQLGR